MDHRAVPDHHPWPDDRIMFEAAIISYHRVIVDDTPAHGTVFPEDYVVIHGRGEDLCPGTDAAVLPDAGIRADQDFIPDRGAGSNRGGTDDLRVPADRDRITQQNGTKDLASPNRDVPPYARIGDVVKFPTFCLPEGGRTSHISPVPPGKPALQPVALFHQEGEEVTGKIELGRSRNPVEYLGVADIYPGACEVGEDLPRSGFFPETPDLVVDIDLGYAVFRWLIDTDETDRNDRALFHVNPVKFKQVDVGHVVPAHHEKVLPVKVFLGIFDAPCGPELGLFMHIGDVDPEE